jgi:hypothetical protein
MARQLVDTNKEVMIVKKNKVIVIDKKDQEKYMKQGWSIAEEVDLDEALSSKDQKAIEDYVSKFMSKMTPDLKAKMEKDPKAAAAVLAKMAMNTEDLDEAKKSALQRLKNFDKSRTAAGKKPIFTDKKKEELDLDEAEAGIKVQAGPDHDGKVKRIQSLAKQLGAKVTSIGKSTDGKMSTIHVKGSMKVVNDLMKLRTEEVELDEDASNFKSAVARINKAKSVKDLHGLEKSFERIYKQTDAFTAKEFGKLDSMIVDKLVKLDEEVELDEAKYDLYHKDFSTAMQHAYAMAKKLHGITISPKEIDDKVATGPAKPKEGKTNSYRLKGDKGAIQVQVYNKGGSKPFELNFYKEEVSLMSAVEEQLAKIKGNTPGDQGRRGAVEDDIERAEKKGDKKLVKKLKEDDLDESPAKVWHLANKKFSLISDKDGYTLVKQGSGEEKKLKAKTPADATAELVKKGYRESVEAEKFRSGQPDLFGEASARADAMKAMRKGKSVDPADVDNIATDDDVKAASKNIMMQLRKAVSLRSYDVEFADGKQKVNQKIAQAVQNKYNSMRRPADKEKYQNFIAKSYKNMLQSLKAGYHEQKESVLDKVGKIIREKNNG